MADPSAAAGRGLLDTSVVIDLETIPATALPDEAAISALTLAELAAGPQASLDAQTRGRRQEHLQRVEALFDPLPFDVHAARAYGRVVGAVAALGRKPRGARSVELLIAATAVANALPLYTRKPDDFPGLESLVELRVV